MFPDLLKMKWNLKLVVQQNLARSFSHCCLGPKPTWTIPEFRNHNVPLFFTQHVEDIAMVTKPSNNVCSRCLKDNFFDNEDNIFVETHLLTAMDGLSQSALIYSNQHPTWPPCTGTGPTGPGTGCLGSSKAAKNVATWATLAAADRGKPMTSWR
jgi:hypothetical protein